MDKFFITQNDEKKYIDKIDGGFILLQNEEKVDLALIKKVSWEKENGDIDEVSITQYLLLTDQLKDGNEWEINKWMIYIFFGVVCFIVNFGFCLAGFVFTLYTIPIILVASFCALQLYRINRKKAAMVIIFLQIFAFIGYPIGIYFFNHFEEITGV